MSKQFRPADQRRVEAAFEEMTPEGYHFQATLSKDRKHMQVVCMDPEDPGVFICNAQFDHQEKMLKGANGLATQPPDLEVMRIAHEFSQIVQAYPADKARQAGEQLFKKDFADRKTTARATEAREAREKVEREEIEAQQRADEKAQRDRDKLLARTDAEEEAAELADLKT